MKNEIALAPTNSLPSKSELEMIHHIIKYAVDSKYFDKVGGYPGALSIALYAREMGLPLMTSLFGGIRPVLGKVEIAPQMMNAMIRKAGHTLQTKEHTDHICVIYGKRNDTGEEMTVSFSIEDAKRANIFKGAWITYPRNMTFKSALSNIAKWLFADVIGMAYVEGELSDLEEEEEINPIQKVHDSLHKASLPTDTPYISCASHEINTVLHDVGLNSDKFVSIMSCDEFVSKLKEKVGDKYTLEKMDKFLEKQSIDKGISPQSVMNQALNASLTARFCRTWYNWHESLKVPEIEKPAMISVS